MFDLIHIELIAVHTAVSFFLKEGVFNDHQYNEKASSMSTCSLETLILQKAASLRIECVQ